MPVSVRHIPPLADKRVLRPAQTALAHGLFTKIDLLRLKAIARLYARGLPLDGAWEDMLQEAITRILTGSRRPPEGATTVAFVAGILRSLRSHYWRRQQRESLERKLRIDDESDGSSALDLVDPTPGPERMLSAQQELTRIKLLFADDPTVLKILVGLAEGLSPEQIRLSAGLTKIDYHSARRRMRRAVLREGLTCEPK